MHARPSEKRSAPRTGIELLQAAHDELRARGAVELADELLAFLARAGALQAQRFPCTTLESNSVAIRLSDHHSLRWLCGKPGAPRRPRVVLCTRCETLCYLGDDDQVATSELKQLIEQHGGAECP